MSGNPPICLIQLTLHELTLAPVFSLHPDPSPTSRHSPGRPAYLPPSHGPFDLILLADTVYQPQSHSTLLSTLAALTTPHTEIAFYAGFHSGRRVVRSFLARAKESGIVPLAPEAWVEVTQEGAVTRPWKWDEGAEDDDKESHEEKARWTVVGRLVREGREG